jgi:hypothetical protein
MDDAARSGTALQWRLSQAQLAASKLDRPLRQLRPTHGGAFFARNPFIHRAVAVIDVAALQRSRCHHADLEGLRHHLV